MARVLIGIPVRHIYGDVSPKTQACLDGLRSFSKHGTEVCLVRGQQISQNSHTLCRRFLDEGWDYLLYTGDDIIFPPWALDRLLAHDKDFVSGICTWKTPPYFVPAGKLGEDGKFRHILIRPEHVANQTMMEVDGTGSGFILMKRAVVQKVWDYMQNVVYPAIPKKHRWLSPIPFFPAVYDPDTDNVASSDFAFSRMARETGTQIFLDCGLICRHRWEGEYDITNHWAWLEKYGFSKTEERFYGDEVPFSPVTEDSVFWGEAGPPVPITLMSTGNEYHAKVHVGPTLNCRFEDIHEEKKPATTTGYALGWHVSDDASWQAYSAWATRYKKVLIHWVGSDLMNINSWLSPERLTHMNSPRFVHVVEDDRMLKEAKHYFGEVQVCPIPTVTIFPPVALPDEFAVAVYYPAHRHDFHYGDVLKQVIKKMPTTKFYLYHLFGDKPKWQAPNMVWLGSLEPSQYGELLANTSCMLRLSKHDGRPFSIVEAAMAGRRFITNFDMPYTHKVSDVPTADGVVKKLLEIKKETEPDLRASHHYTHENDLLIFKSRIRKLAGIPEPHDGIRDYDYMAYWDGRYEGDADYAGEVNVERDKVVNDTVFAAIKDGECESMLDVGCGTGHRWGELPVKDYTGVDVSPTAIRCATEKYTDGKFFVADLARDPLPPADIVTALSVLNHIRPADFDEVLRKLLNLARKKFVAIVTQGGDKSQYQFELPSLDMWGLGDSWDVQVQPMNQEETIALLTLTRKKEEGHPAKSNSSDPVIQSV